MHPPDLLPRQLDHLLPAHNGPLWRRKPGTSARDDTPALQKEAGITLVAEMDFLLGLLGQGGYGDFGGRGCDCCGAPDGAVGCAGEGEVGS